MRQRFRARELWLLAPFLLIIAGAWYWARVKRVSKPGASEMFVSNVKIEAPSGYWQEKGFSHQLVVTLSHPWPKPRWWRNQIAGYKMDIRAPLPSPCAECGKGTQLAVIAKEGRNGMLLSKQGETFQPLDYEYLEDHVHEDMEGHGSYVYNRQSKSHVYTQDNGDYVYKHLFKGSSLPKELGEIHFRANYGVRGYDVLPLEYVVRKAGEVLPMEADKRPGARVVKVVTSPFYSRQGAKAPLDDFSFALILQSEGATEDQMQSAMQGYFDWSLTDGKGRKFEEGAKSFGCSDFDSSGIESVDREKTLLQAGQSIGIFNCYLNKSMVTSGDLTLRGKTSIGMRWPLEVEVKLPPRPVATAPK